MQRPWNKQRDWKYCWKRYFLCGPLGGYIKRPTEFSSVRENIGGLNLAVVKPTTVQVTKLPLQHKIRNIVMICSVKPVLTVDLCVVQKEEIFNNMLYVWNVYLTKYQAYSWETNPSSRQRGCYIRTTTVGVQLKRILVVGLKGLHTKTNWLAVNRQS
jgi:hypothetical protein